VRVFDRLLVQAPGAESVSLGVPVWAPSQPAVRITSSERCLSQAPVHHFPSVPGRRTRECRRPFGDARQRDYGMRLSDAIPDTRGQDVTRHIRHIPDGRLTFAIDAVGSVRRVGSGRAPRTVDRAGAVGPAKGDHPVPAMSSTPCSSVLAQKSSTWSGSERNTCPSATLPSTNRKA
jgi:hypothetical protein